MKRVRSLIIKLNYILDKKQKRYFCFLFFVFTGGAFCELLGISAISPLLSLFSNPEKTSENNIFISFCAIFNIKSIMMSAVVLTLLIALIYIVKNAYLCMQLNFIYKFVYQNQRKLAVRMLDCYLKQNYLFHVTNNISELQRNITTDVAQFWECVLSFLRLLSEGLVCVFIIVYLLATDFEMTIVALIIVCSFMLLFLNIYRKKLTSLGQENRIKYAEQNKWILQALGGIKDVKILDKEDFFIGKFNKSYYEYAEANRKHSLIVSVQKPIIETGCVCGLLFIVAVRIFLGAELETMVTSLGILAIAAFRILPSLNRISDNVNNILFYKASVNSLYDDLKELARIEIKKDKVMVNETIDYTEDNFLKVDNIYFKYPGGERYIFKDVSFFIKQKQSIGIVGVSGGGKSTLADILLGLLYPDRGTILYEGEDIHNCIEKWHRAVGYVPQAIYLTDDTIRNNIAFGIDENEIDDSRISKVIEDAQLTEFISSLSEGVETIVGDRGVRLSGGQRQRIGIARALYNNPQVLILDEATSALDNDTEAAVMEAIEKLQGSITLVIIAHRLSTLEKCDIVYEVSDMSVTVRTDIKIK